MTKAKVKKPIVGADQWRSKLKTISKKLMKVALDECGEAFGAKIALFNATSLLNDKMKEDKVKEEK